MEAIVEPNGPVVQELYVYKVRACRLHPQCVPTITVHQVFYTAACSPHVPRMGERLAGV